MAGSSPHAVTCGSTLVVSGLILTLAYGLFRRAVPVLVDHIAVDPDALQAAVDSVLGVRSTRRVPSRAGGGGATDRRGVDRELSTEDSHGIADAIEQALRTRFASEEVTVHIESD